MKGFHVPRDYVSFHVQGRLFLSFESAMNEDVAVSCYFAQINFDCSSYRRGEGREYHVSSRLLVVPRCSLSIGY